MKKTLTVLLLLGFALAACDDGKDDNQTEQPEYRTDTVTFAFIDMAGDPVAETKKATVKGTMLLADWNNAKTAIKSRIENTQNTATGFPRGRFLTVFADDQNTAIIFDPNAGNGKYEVKDGEFRNLYINPSALNSITNEEIINAVTAMNAQEPAKDGTPQPIDKTFPITLKDGALVFTVAYKALPSDAEPAYLTYIKERLEAVASNTSNTTIMAVDNLIAKGSSYTIRIVAGNEAGFTWNAATREFEIQHDWISTATDTDLTLAMLRSAFNSVEAE